PPNLLLLPPDVSSGALIQLTASESLSASDAWQWATRTPKAEPAYLRLVRRIAPPDPPGLNGREEELAELARVCLGPDSGPYAWWQAGPWAGKTALMSTFVLRPPPKVRERARIVSFFVTARLAAQDTREAFTHALLDQLSGLTGQELPAVVSEASR